MTARTQNRVAALVGLAALLLPVTAACSSSTSTDATPPGTPAVVATGAGAGSSTSVDRGGVTAAGSTFTTIADLAQALDDHGLTCALEYPGLKDDVTDAELSICTIGGEQAYLRVWSDAQLLEAFLASPDGRSGVVAVGANWMITCATPETANRIAEAIGGSVPGGS